ncbi:adenylyltransferase/sulfurtransferase MoeZ [Nocardioides sp. zg-1230]|nr:adenylyltransferase/sulfurtransferase MoeZ [Nocardioides sp. zg-1230]
MLRWRHPSALGRHRVRIPGPVGCLVGPRGTWRTRVLLHPHPSQGEDVSFPALVEPAAELTTDEVRRYSRHLIIPDVGMAGQKRLKNAKVLVIGAGGLGSPALLYLAAAGVGTLGIAEFDEVDESNLQRQIIHGMSDIGRSKAESAKESIAEVNPYVEVVVHPERLDNDNVLQVFEGYDLIVDGTDNFATRYMVNDAAYFLKIPYVWGSIYRFDGQASVFAPTLADDAPCYRCLYPEPPPPGMVPSCAEGGVLGVLCASIGSIQVNEAIKLLTGIGDPAIGKLVIYDALELEWRKLKVRKDPSCALCGENPTVTGLIDYDAFCGAVSDEAAEAAAGSTISVTQLEAMLKEREEGARDFELIDVREPNEFEINRIPGARLVPKGEFLNGNALGDLPSDKPIVLHCKSGVRSAEVLAIVKGAGYADAVHVGGGVVAWVSQVDPSQPAY